ncbi:ribosome hibernation-promoting factor, HPF/YfiA family [Arthrobacter sp. STN4]|uniref:ribosome hibernation-promoting factor, HPF/YfiA family n=1 Tax=Arthrobacter sp. STN4 TaxID=2923276 RepID=UPI002119EF26|nr:ribosome-associated translation inhibitor RaiA [Arthrobacter sp. STN4]MCQ9163050.1 ribosome-associated translation inhibitor RaiA [Arthrobacter sp. STN4]
MEFMISGRNLSVSDRFREYAGEKLTKIEQLANKVQRVDVKISKESKSRSAETPLTVELTVLGRGPVIRAEAAASDKFAAFDLAYGKLLERLRRAKDRKKVHHGRHAPVAVNEATGALTPVSSSEPIYAQSEPEAATERSPYEIENDIPAGDSPVLIRRKVFPAASLSVDDAVDNMELVGHDFYLFMDSATGIPSVVYRRSGWTYGVISLDPNADEGTGAEEISAYRSPDEPAKV